MLSIIWIFLLIKKYRKKTSVQALRRLKAKDIFLDLEVECPDRENIDVNIYGSRVRPEDLEDC
jgi:hypothetical protein